MNYFLKLAEDAIGEAGRQLAKEDLFNRYRIAIGKLHAERLQREVDKAIREARLVIAAANFFAALVAVKPPPPELILQEGGVLKPVSDRETNPIVDAERTRKLLERADNETVTVNVNSGD